MQFDQMYQLLGMTPDDVLREHLDLPSDEDVTAYRERSRLQLMQGFLNQVATSSLPIYPTPEGIVIEFTTREAALEFRNLARQRDLLAESEGHPAFPSSHGREVFPVTVRHDTSPEILQEVAQEFTQSQNRGNHGRSNFQMN